jgi:hypothetical protein
MAGKNRIEINSGLGGYVLINNITGYSGTEINGIVRHDNAPACIGIESLAQLASMHVRKLHDFNNHAALLKINDIHLKKYGSLNGDYSISAKLTSRSERAFIYFSQSLLNNDIIIEGSFIITLLDYNDKFKKEILERHYKNLFSCLTKK